MYITPSSQTLLQCHVVLLIVSAKIICILLAQVHAVPMSDGTHLCDDDVALGSALIGYHVVEDELWDLCCLATPSVALDDHHLVTLDGRHYLSRPIRYRQPKTIL